MGQITRAQRIARIKELVAEQSKIPPTERHEAARLPAVTGDPLICPVIVLSVDEVVLNHRSHRVRSYLEDDPDWEKLEEDPQSEPAQRLIERMVREGRKPDEFAALKESLAVEGQTDPGVVTYDGVLINANTRAVALREFDEPEKRFIRVAVLPQTVQQHQLALLELRLQMRKELKVDYSLTNELLFIEELSTDRKMTNAQIARELRIFPESQKKGENEISLRLRFLDLIREMQQIPVERLRLRVFDEISYQQLREVYRPYSQLVETDPARAHRFLESFLLSIAVGVTAVHQIRHIDSTFVGDYMLPQLEDPDVLGEMAGNLVQGNRPTTSAEASNHLLAIEDEDSEDGVDVRGLIDVVTRRDKRVEVPGSNFVLTQQEVSDAVKGAIISGITLKRRDAADADKLEAPIAAVKTATREVKKALEAVKVVLGDDDFDQKRRKSLEAAFNKLKRSVRGLEKELAEDDVVRA